MCKAITSDKLNIASEFTEKEKSRSKLTTFCICKTMSNLQVDSIRIWKNPRIKKKKVNYHNKRISCKKGKVKKCITIIHLHSTLHQSSIKKENSKSRRAPSWCVKVILSLDKYNVALEFTEKGKIKK